MKLYFTYKSNDDGISGFLSDRGYWTYAQRVLMEVTEVSTDNPKSSTFNDYSNAGIQVEVVSDHPRILLRRCLGLLKMHHSRKGVIYDYSKPSIEGQVLVRQLLTDLHHSHLFSAARTSCLRLACNLASETGEFTTRFANAARLGTRSEVVVNAEKQCRGFLLHHTHCVLHTLALKTCDILGTSSTASICHLWAEAPQYQLLKTYHRRNSQWTTTRGGLHEKSVLLSERPTTHSDAAGLSIEEIDYNRYPTKQFQISWLQVYLQTFLNNKNPTAEDINKLYLEVDQFSIASHFLWGIWSLVQYELSDIDFDFGGLIPLRVPEKKGLDRQTYRQQSDPIRFPFFPFEYQIQSKDQGRARVPCRGNPQDVQTSLRLLDYERIRATCVAMRRLSLLNSFHHRSRKA
ncbi:Ethanolamine kinase [Eumeta japonica]|uniref:ethanolamine kinase n=1 Tax=Eumeta variegata TaxID=151549 RepID=A0A4C1X9F4_EUMVA|nr:Ethanolamine kinase [Eumeta japonica]